MVQILEHVAPAGADARGKAFRTFPRYRAKVQHQDQLRQRLRESIGAFSVDPDGARKKLAEMLTADPPVFQTEALSMLPEVRDPAPRKCLLELMLKANLLPACDPALAGLQEEAALVRELSELDPLLDMRLARRLSGFPAEGVPDEVAQRVLSLLCALPENARVLPMLIRLVRHPSPGVRSKAALVIGRVSKTPQMTEEMLLEPDPRVRANAVEALWGVDSARARAVLREAAEDPNNRVAGNALLGLYRLGETSSILRILSMAAHPKAERRATAAWVMEQTGSPRFLPVLAQMVRESDPRARSRVFRAIAGLKRGVSGAADLPRLRVHLTDVSRAFGGACRVTAVIASESGREVFGLPGTALLLSEDERMVADYSVRRIRPPASVALAVVLPHGDSGGRALAAVSTLRRDQDRWSNSRYGEGGIVGALEQAFAFLASSSADRHLIFVTPPAPEAESAAAPWEAYIARARTASIAVHTVPDSFENPDLTVAGCEKAYLALLYSYEILCRGSGAPGDPEVVKLEVYGGQGYGSDVWRAPAPGPRPAA
jgi:HEAT repeat protein